MGRRYSKKLVTTLRLEIKFSKRLVQYIVYLIVIVMCLEGDVVANLLILLSFAGHSVSGWTDV